MSFAGDYKLIKVRRMKKTEDGFELVDVEKALSGMDEDDRGELQRDINTILSVQEDGSIQYLMPLPEGATEAEVKEAGLEMVDGKVKMGEAKGKIENGALYMHDASKFLAGTEWVKISTDVEGELDLIAMYYKKI